jgi:Helix-turn-helix domain
MTDTIERLLYSRKDAAKALSISLRSIDYLVSNKKLKTRRLASRVLIPRSELLRLARGDHHQPLAD